MSNRPLVGVQRKPCEPISFPKGAIEIAVAVSDIADERVICVFEMAANLMQSSRERHRFHEGNVPRRGLGNREGLHEGSGGHFGAIFLAADGVINVQCDAQFTTPDSDVTLVASAFLHLTRKKTRDLGGLGEDYRAAGAAIESLNRVCCAITSPVPRKIHEGDLVHAPAPMDEEARGLVEHEELRIFVEAIDLHG